MSIGLITFAFLNLKRVKETWQADILVSQFRARKLSRAKIKIFSKIVLSTVNTLCHHYKYRRVSDI